MELFDLAGIRKIHHRATEVTEFFGVGFASAGLLVGSISYSNVEANVNLQNNFNKQGD